MAVWHIAMYKKSKLKGNGGEMVLFWPTVRKKCCSDREKLLKFEAEGQEFAKGDV